MHSSEEVTKIAQQLTGLTLNERCNLGNVEFLVNQKIFKGDWLRFEDGFFWFNDCSISNWQSGNCCNVTWSLQTYIKNSYFNPFVIKSDSYFDPFKALVPLNDAIKLAKLLWLTIGSQRLAYILLDLSNGHNLYMGDVCIADTGVAFRKRVGEGHCGYTDIVPWSEIEYIEVSTAFELIDKNKPNHYARIFFDQHLDSVLINFILRWRNSQHFPLSNYLNSPDIYKYIDITYYGKAERFRTDRYYDKTYVKWDYPK